MDRRTFLRGVAALPAIPTAAPAAAQTSPVDALAASHAAAKAEVKEFDRLAQSIYEDPKRPEYGRVLYSEMHYSFRPTAFRKDARCLSQADLDVLLDRRKFQIGLLKNPDDYEGEYRLRMKARHDRDIAEAEAEHSRLCALLKERQAISEKWAIESGWKAADERSDRMWDRVFDLADEILYFDCQTIEDVRAVARFIRVEYGDEFSEEAANQFIERLAGGPDATPAAAT